MGPHGTQWDPMEPNGTPLITMGHRGPQWDPINPNGTPLNTMGPH